MIFELILVEIYRSNEYKQLKINIMKLSFWGFTNFGNTCIPIFVIFIDMRLPTLKSLAKLYKLRAWLLQTSLLLVLYY